MQEDPTTREKTTDETYSYQRSREIEALRLSHVSRISNHRRDFLLFLLFPRLSYPILLTRPRQLSIAFIFFFSPAVFFIIIFLLSCISLPLEYRTVQVYRRAYIAVRCTPTHRLKWVLGHRSTFLSRPLALPACLVLHFTEFGKKNAIRKIIKNETWPRIDFEERIWENIEAVSVILLRIDNYGVVRAWSLDSSACVFLPFFLLLTDYNSKDLRTPPH